MNYNEEAGVIISTHLISDVEKVLDDVIFIRNGNRQELFFYLVTEILFAMAYKYAIDRTTTIFHILLNGFLCPRLRKHERYQ